MMAERASISTKRRKCTRNWWWEKEVFLVRPSADMRAGFVELDQWDVAGCASVVVAG